MAVTFGVLKQVVEEAERLGVKDDTPVRLRFVDDYIGVPLYKATVVTDWHVLHGNLRHIEFNP
jgi:hypothetical protein